jgi:xanthine dehydrogenase accessory factor
VIGLGPGFTAGKDVHYVIETKRGHFLGRVIDRGCAIPNTGVPGIIGGEGERRVIRSPGAGFFAAHREIGDVVSQGDFLGYVGDVPITANIAGLIRGLIHPAVPVHKGMKIGDIDPRNVEGSWQTISDKAFSIAGGVVEAMFNVHKYTGSAMPLHYAAHE